MRRRLLCNFYLYMIYLFLLPLLRNTGRFAWQVFTAGDGGGSRSIHVFPYRLMYVVREPSVPERNRNGKLILPFNASHSNGASDKDVDLSERQIQKWKIHFKGHESHIPISESRQLDVIMKWKLLKVKVAKIQLDVLLMTSIKLFFPIHLVHQEHPSPT